MVKVSEEIINNICSRVLTEKGLNDLILSLNDVVKNTFTLGGSKNLPENVKPFLVDLPDRENIDTLKTLLDELSKVEVCEVTLAREPSPGFFTTLHKWFEDHGIRGFVFGVKYKPELLGGAIFSVRGRYLDLSLGKLVRNYIGANVNALEGILHSKVQ